MPRPKNPVPVYRHHKPSGQAYCYISVNGRRKDVYLGPWNSDESKAEFERVCREHRASQAAAVAIVAPKSGAVVSEVVLAFLRHADAHYRRPDGTPTHEVVEYRHVVRPLVELYGGTPAGEFGPLALQAVRDKMVDLGWCRPLVNRRVGRLRHVFKWAASQELVPAGVLEGLRAVGGLQRGRTRARDPEPVQPVPPADLERTLPFLTPRCGRWCWCSG